MRGRLIVYGFAGLALGIAAAGANYARDRRGGTPASG